jgi:prepilin-type N-terminal cleavage/methylation domain-containing protein
MIPVPSSSLGPVGPASMGVCGLSSVPSHRSPVKCAARGGRRKSPPLAGGCSTAQPSFARAVGGLPHRAAMGRAAAFTLIELLVVISIIAILAALAFPAVNGAIGSARKAQARNDVQQIALAIKSFASEYGHLPSSVTDSEEWISDNGNLMKILTGELGQALNPKNIKFFDPKLANKAKGGLYDGKYYDPWGELYLIKLNTDYTNKIEYYGDKIVDVIVLSKGPNKVQNDPNSGDDIFNFK